MCAAPRRPRAAFCHRCGKSFPEESAVVYNTNKNAVGAATNNEFGEQLTRSSDEQAATAAQTAPILQPISAKPETESDESVAIEETKVEENAARAEIAAEKTFQKTRVKHRVVRTTEYVWEESASDPTWKFALATIVIFFFVLLVLWFGNFINF